MTWCGSPTDAALVGLIFLLHGGQSMIPTEVPQLTAGERAESRVTVMLRERDPELEAVNGRH